MQTRSLSGPAIAAIRALIMAKCSRGDIKQFLLEAGANHQRVLAIPVHEGIRSPGYKSKNDIVNLGFDTVYQDFEPVEANGIALQLVRIVVQRKGLERDDSALQEVEGPLVACGFSLSEVIGSDGATPTLETAHELALNAGLIETTDLLAKALQRMFTDPQGTITASVTAAESVCRVALERLGLELPAKKQLPNYLNRLCDCTNLESLARVGGDQARKVFGSLRGLAGNAYEAAHEFSDRHAHGDEAPWATAFVADLLASSSATLILTIAGALRRGELRAISRTKNENR